MQTDPRLLVPLIVIALVLTPMGQAEAEDARPAAAGPATPQVTLERLSAAVPWPRGLAWSEDRLIVLARGRHRRAGGVDPSIDDKAGSLFIVDPAIAEPFDGRHVFRSDVRTNAVVLASPSSPPFALLDRHVAPSEQATLDRPYCTLVWDEPSRNLFICGYAGIDLPNGRFRKNASDAIFRFDLRDETWRIVERHDATQVARSALGPVVPSATYPHHDPDAFPPPHGWTNGANGATIAGDTLYVAAKDNHRVVAYDLTRIRETPAAPPPPSRSVIDEDVRVRTSTGTERAQARGPSALAMYGDFLYVGYRTTSDVLRFPLRRDGSLCEPVIGERVARFEPYDPITQESADLVDLTFDRDGFLYVSCARRGRIWRFLPDSASPFDGNDRDDRATTAAPYVDLPAHAGVPIRSGNMVTDAEGRLYICAGTYGSDRGQVLRATPIADRRGSARARARPSAP